MAVELASTNIVVDNHLLLDQPLLRVPHELHRRVHKAAQRLLDHEKEYVNSKITQTAQNATEDNHPDTLGSIDEMIQRMESLKRKLSKLSAEEQKLLRQSKVRAAHVKELESIPSAADVKYDKWSKTRLDRLLVDYLLRSGYVETAKKLAKSQEVEDLVDIDAFTQCQKLESGLLRGETKEALSWCADNKQSLKKMNSELEYELRLQEYIEMVRTRDKQRMHQATVHAKKYLTPYEDKNFSIRAAGLLAFPANTLMEPYMSLYAPARWHYLSKLFLRTYHNLLSLPQNPPLHIALSAGLSALKTPSCHSSHPSPSSALNANTISSSTPQNDSHNSGSDNNATNHAPIGQSVCPICSTELNALARNVPYAHHSRSVVEPDPVVLPNGRVYGRLRLMAFQSKIRGVGIAGGADIMMDEVFDEIIDPADPEYKCRASDLRKVYIS